MQQDKLYIDLGMSENQYSKEIIEGQQVYTLVFEVLRSNRFAHYQYMVLALPSSKHDRFV